MRSLAYAPGLIDILSYETMGGLAPSRTAPFSHTPTPPTSIYQYPHPLQGPYIALPLTVVVTVHKQLNNTEDSYSLLLYYYFKL